MNTDYYKSKMGGRGKILLELYMWLLCPIVTILNYIAIGKMYFGVAEFSAYSFLNSLICGTIALLVTITAIYLSKPTFWCCVTLPIIWLIEYSISAIASVILLSSANESTGGVLTALIGTVTAANLIVNVIVVVILISFILYLFGNKSIFYSCDD